MMSIPAFSSESATPEPTFGKSRLAVLLRHFSTIGEPCDVRRILHPLYEVPLLVVCAMIADCDDYDHIAAWARGTSPSCAGTCPPRMASRAGAG